MAEDQAPPVVAVVVSSDPGPWLEESLTALAGQDYTNLTVLVVDAASTESLAPRVAAVAPDFYLLRLEENRGFGPSANAALAVIEGGSHYLFCHDDVTMAPDALHKMIEESFRSNAGIVAPKFVDPNDPERILQVGLGVDRYGAPVRRIRTGEIDQSQHDEVREVFAAPGGCTLVRSDLFAAIGGYDPEISMFGEDIDLCWRARIAGARIVVAPTANVGHREATAARQRPLPEARSLQWRHELRAILKNYGRPRRLLVGTQLAILSLAEVVYFLAIGKRRRVRQVIDAWRWNLAPARELKAARAAVAATRRLPDRVVCGLFTRRTSRIWRFVSPVLEETAIRWSRARHEARLENLLEAPEPTGPTRHLARRPRHVTLGAAAAVLVLLVGARSLIDGHFPLIGQFLPFPGPTHLLGDFFGGWRDAGLQRTGPVTPAFAFLGVFGLVLFGATTLVVKVGLIVTVIAGALGVARLVRPFGPPLARLAAALAYLFLPLAWNDFARGDLQGLVAYGGMPFILSRLARSSAAPPFVGRHEREPDRWREVLGLGILLTVLAAFDPVVIVLTLVCAVALVLGSVVAGEPAGARRTLTVSFGGAGVAFVALFPWSLTFIQPGARFSVLAGSLTTPGRTPDLAALLRFNLGPLGAGVLGYAFLAAALAVLFLGRDERFTWGVRLWVVALAALGFAWAAAEGWLGAGGGATASLLTPVAACIACLVGCGAAAIGTDVVGRHFGRRHVVAGLFVICALAGLLPVLGASGGGRFGLPSIGYDAILSWADGSGAAASSQRILWLGDPRALPLSSWQVEPGLAIGVSSGGLPDGTRIWPSSNPGVATSLADALELAASGLTVRLGTVLASAGVRYVIVPTALAPVLPGSQQATSAPPTQLVLDGLSAQQDLHALPSEGGVLVFENAAWHPGVAVPLAVANSGGTPAPLRALAVALEVVVWLALGIALHRRRRIGRERHRRAPPPTVALVADEPVTAPLAKVSGV